MRPEWEGRAATPVRQHSTRKRAWLQFACARAGYQHSSLARLSTRCLSHRRPIRLYNDVRWKLVHIVISTLRRRHVYVECLHLGFVIGFIVSHLLFPILLLKIGCGVLGEKFAVTEHFHLRDLDVSITNSLQVVTDIL